MKAVEQQQPNSMDSSDSVTGGSEYAYRPLTTKHRRAGSTGTTGDEEYTTDEDELYTDETDCASIVHHQQNPILKSDLARAATDLFGYSTKQDDNNEPTSLFDDDDANMSPHSANKVSSAHFLYNEKSYFHDDAQTSKEEHQKSSVVNNEETSNKVNEKIDKTGKTSEFINIERPMELEMTVNNTSLSVETKATHNMKLKSSSNKPELQVTLDNVETLTTAERNWEKTVAEVKEHAITKLQDELKRANEELKLKDEEVTRLLRFRQDVETELEELTASLFQEAHNMVREANTRQATAERLLEESRMKVEVLAAEVVALKTLVLTSTPAQPNPHLHPQIDSRTAVRCKSTSSADDNFSSSGGLFAKKHRRSPSHMNLKYGRENSPPDSPVKEQRGSLGANEVYYNDNTSINKHNRDTKENRDNRDNHDKDNDRERDNHESVGFSNKHNDTVELSIEIDPRVQFEFLKWKMNPCIDISDEFVARVFREDIDLCLDFPNSKLGNKVRQAVLDGIIFIEAISDKSKNILPQNCALLEVMRPCQYRMRLGDNENQWHCISQICRNRITAVCDFLNYLRYVERGLVKSSVQDIYWEIVRLRKEMVLARLGLSLSS